MTRENPTVGQWLDAAKSICLKAASVVITPLWGVLATRRAHKRGETTNTSNAACSYEIAGGMLGAIAGMAAGRDFMSPFYIFPNEIAAISASALLGAAVAGAGLGLYYDVWQPLRKKGIPVRRQAEEFIGRHLSLSHLRK